jgi:two-component system, cell cycle sensor histidine kinase and response regulator CckA
VHCLLEVGEDAWKFMDAGGEVWFTWTPLHQWEAAPGLTARRKAVHSRDSETAGAAAFMQQFQRHAAIMLLIGQEDGRIVDANPAAVRFYGYPHDVLCGMRVHDINQAPAAEVGRTLAQAVREEQNYFVFLHRLASGAVRTVEVYSSPVEIGGRQHLFSIIHDISDRVHAEKALRDSEEKFSKAFHGSPDSININRFEDGVYLEINEGFTRTTGYTQADVLGRSSRPSDLGIWVEPKDRQRMLDGLVEHGEVELEAPFRRKDGTILVGLMSARLIDIDGVKCILTITRDITERRRMEEALLTAQKLESISLLAGGIAHDFNNLLAGILGNLTLARMEIDGSHVAGLNLQSAERAVLSARNLTQQLLTFARGGAPVKGLTDVGELIRDAAGLVSHGTSCVCEFEISPVLWPAEIDAGQLGQVVQNIVINAVQAMPKGGKITLSAGNASVEPDNPYALAAGSYIEVSITDEGTGIPDDQVKKIFDPYFTTKEGGSGLGLATSYSILRNHRGYLGARSVQGRGSTFTFLVPAEPRRKVPSSAQEDIVVSGRGRRVLVMDDQELVRTMVERMLTHLGFATQGASNGSEAVRLFEAARREGAPFDLAVLDLTIIGGMGGKETLNTLLSIDPTVKVIVSSGYSTDPVLAHHREYGAAGVLPKPYRLVDLKKVLRDIGG